MIWLTDQYGFDIVDHKYYHDGYSLDALRHKSLEALLRCWARRLFGVMLWC